MAASRPNIFVSIFYFAVYVFVCFVSFVLFGAPILYDHFETLLLAGVFALLSGGPFLLNFRLNTENLNSVLWLPNSKSEYFACCSFWGTLIGTWSSSFFLVLDWDRPWQEWPIPCLYGAFFGFVMGCLTFIVRPFAAPACSSFFQKALDTTDLVKVRFD